MKSQENFLHEKKTSPTRRRFLKSMGLFFGGIGLVPSRFIFTGRNHSGENFNPLTGPFPAVDFPGAVKLPDGVKAVWDLAKAFHQTTPTRERICINGLWLWQPGGDSDQIPPSDDWGYFKVPGNWPGFTNWMQHDSQRVYKHPAWENTGLGELTTAWYQREINIPANWSDGRIILGIDYLNSFAEIFLDGKKSGEMLFPSGELDITDLCQPGKNHLVAIKVTALPQQDVVAVFSDSNAPKTGKATVMRKGLCGDVYLNREPVNEKIGNVKIDTSFRKKEIILSVTPENLKPGKRYFLHAVIDENGNPVKEFTGTAFDVSELTDGLLTVNESWKPEKLWDTHTPENKYTITVSLLDGKRKVMDEAFPVKFGYREFWIDGRDFYLNGTRIFLSAVPLDNAQGGAIQANYEAARETMLRLQSFGINFVYTHNYGCEPGTHLSFDEILRAADDTGMLISFSQPHYGQYNWDDPDADNNNGYAHHAAFYVKAAENHPSVVFYSMNHNATGYTEDMNPDMIDGIANPRSPAALRNAAKAQRVEAIVHKLDPYKVIYHHSSGNLSSMHTSNFYPNWVPVQEMADWFEHWSEKGVKPLFTCEFGSPFTWDWGMYRGWYKGKREFGSAKVPWEFCLAEWNAQFLGDSAYRISDYEKENLRWEAAKFKAGEVWGRNDYPYNFDTSVFVERDPVFAMHIREQWRAFRTREVSADSPWHFSPYWRLKEDADKSERELPVDWEHLQYPGFSPDYLGIQRTRMDLGYKRSDWTPTIAAMALINNNKSTLAYIAGKPEAVTGKDHNFFPGEKVVKQIILINNSRVPVSFDYRWSVKPFRNQDDLQTVKVATGEQVRIPVEFEIPAGHSAGNYNISLSVNCSNGDSHDDEFSIHVLPEIRHSTLPVKIALWDPEGETGKLLSGLGINYRSIGPEEDLAPYDILVIGRRAFTAEGPGINIDSVREGLKVIVFEQHTDVLEKRFGFRVEEYGLRNVYRRIPRHPVLEGLDNINLTNWRGDATLLPPRLDLKISDTFRSPSVRWCDIEVTRIWRCGNRGNVASVLIEKPQCGNFIPLIDGGFSQQFSPLMEYREGRGMILFCQLDVTGRSESEPAAEKLTGNIFNYVAGWKPSSNKSIVYAGTPEGKLHLERSSFNVEMYKGGKPKKDSVLVIGPGGEDKLPSNAGALKRWMNSGGKILLAGLDDGSVKQILPEISLGREEFISCYYDSYGIGSNLVGIGPADTHNRSPKIIPLVKSGAIIAGNGIVAQANDGRAVLYQMVPWELDYSNGQHNVKQTFRHSSFVLNRLLGNLDVSGSVPLIERFYKGIDSAKTEKRWLAGMYLDDPEEWDDPYRFFRW